MHIRHFKCRVTVKYYRFNKTIFHVLFHIDIKLYLGVLRIHFFFFERVKMRLSE